MFEKTRYQKIEDSLQVTESNSQITPSNYYKGFPGGSDAKESACNVGDQGSILGLGRSPGEGNGYSLHYSCLGNPMDRGVLWAIIHSVAKSQIRLSDRA